MPGDLFSLFRERGQRSAVTFVRRAGSRRYAGDELFAAALDLAERLDLKQRPPGATIGLLFRTQHMQVLAYLACLSAGLTPAILTPFHTKLSKGVFEEALAAGLRNASLSVLLSDTDLPGFGGAPFALDDGAQVFVADLGVRTQARGILQFSSGTTGLKKCVNIPFDALHAQLETYGRAIGLSREDHVLSWLPLYHDMGFIACLNLPLFHGVDVTMIETLDWLFTPELFFLEAHRTGATLSWNPNFFFSFMAERIDAAKIEGVSLRALRGLVNCSEPVTARSQARFRDRFQEFGLRPDVFWGCYAMAETTFALTHITESESGYTDPTGPKDTTVRLRLPSISVGKPLPGVILRVVSEAGVEAPEREVGEIIVSSPFNFSGYVGAGDVDHGAFATGDLGYRIGDRYFVTGRKKDAIAINGDKIAAHHVEELVSEIPGVAAGRVCAFGAFDDAMQSERLIVLAELDDAANADTFKTSAVQSAINRHFFISNAEIVALPRGALLKSSSGKISRARCKEWWRAQRPGAADADS